MPLVLSRRGRKLRGPRWLRAMVAAPLLLLLPDLASAQNGEAKPPFYSKDAGGGENDTAFFGSITSSNFYFSESGTPTLIGVAGTTFTENASPVSRVFSEMRLQLQADHIAGGELDFKADVRGRFQLERCAEKNDNETLGCLPSQSGTFGGTERDVREFYLRYHGPSYDLTAGRQYMIELAAIKFDGIRYQQTTDPKLKYFGFAGLYPTRGSRDLVSDYPTVLSDPANPMSSPTRLLPVVAGGGASYNRGRLYGSVGVAAILPRGKERILTTPNTSLAERRRILLSSNGYWAQSEKTDIYHYIVLDAAGAAGAGISNLSVGVNHRPATSVNLFAQVNRVDTETLNVQAQTRLEEVDPNNLAGLGNNWYVTRVAQESLRAGASSAFSQNRFQLTASGALRRRPEIALRRNGDDADPAVATDNDLLLPLAQALDITLHLVDRKSFERFRIGASVTRSAGFGDENLDRSKSTSAVLQGSRDLLDGKGEFELNLNYVKAADDDRTAMCPLDIVNDLTCYGTSLSSTLGAGAMLFYRPDRNWFAMGMVSAARQTITTSDPAGVNVRHPAITALTAFARLGYRF